MSISKTGQKRWGEWGLVLLTAAVFCCGNVPQAVCSVPNILTSSLHLGYIGVRYSAVLTASSGTSPYSWRVGPGQLPPGLSLAPTGQISGTPTAGGTFGFSVMVQDSAGQTASKNFALTIFHQPVDAYGGFTNLACPSGPRGHFYVQKIGSRWHLCTPAGNTFWMNGIYNTGGMADSPTDYQGISLRNLIASKYAHGSTTDYTLNWALQTVERMRSWGFNEIAEYALGWVLPVAVHPKWTTADHTIPVRLPFSPIVCPALYALKNSSNYASGPVKDIVYGIKTTVYTGYRATSPDFWDPNYSQYLTGSLKYGSWEAKYYQGLHNDYLVGLTIDEADRLQGFGAGPDFPTVASGVIDKSRVQPHLAWMVLVTAATQSSNAAQGVTYTDTKVYSKAQLSQWLSRRYAGNISALNAAWGSRYTTFDASGAGWGAGTGLLDEDGLCPSKAGTQTCWVPKDAVRLTGASARMRADLDDFLAYHAQGYFSMIRQVLNAQAPGVLYMGPTYLGTWGTPSRRQIYQAATQYVDVYNLGGIPPHCTNCTDSQARIDFVAQCGGDKPWTNWEGFIANPDSYMSPYPGDGFPTQADRGQWYTEMMSGMVNAKDSATATYHVVGIKWWELYDNRGLKADFGLLTRRDNPYDGISATTTSGMDSWGYPTGCLPTYGCERANYGNFLDSVTRANLNAFDMIASGN